MKGRKLNKYKSLFNKFDVLTNRRQEIWWDSKGREMTNKEKEECQRLTHEAAILLVEMDKCL